MDKSNAMLMTLVVLLLFFIIIGAMLVQWNRTDSSLSNEERAKKSGNLGIALVVIGAVVLAMLGGYKVYEMKKNKN